MSNEDVGEPYRLPAIVKLGLFLLGIFVIANYVATLQVGPGPATSSSQSPRRSYDLTIGQILTMPESRQPACRKWESIESIYREQVRLSQEAAERLLGRLARTGECYMPKVGEQVTVTRVGLTSFQFRRVGAEAGDEYWTAIPY